MGCRFVRSLVCLVVHLRACSHAHLNVLRGRAAITYLELTIIPKLASRGLVSFGPALATPFGSELQVVKQSPHVESCAAFNMSYTDSGLYLGDTSPFRLSFQSHSCHFAFDLGNRLLFGRRCLIFCVSLLNPFRRLLVIFLGGLFLQLESVLVPQEATPVPQESVRVPRIDSCAKRIGCCGTRIGSCDTGIGSCATGIDSSATIIDARGTRIDSSAKRIDAGATRIDSYGFVIQGPGYWCPCWKMCLGGTFDKSLLFLNSGGWSPSSKFRQCCYGFAACGSREV